MFITVMTVISFISTKSQYTFNLTVCYCHFSYFLHYIKCGLIKILTSIESTIPPPLCVNFVLLTEKTQVKYIFALYNMKYFNPT